VAGWDPDLAEIPERFAKRLVRQERIVLAVRRHPAQVLEPVLSAVAALVGVLWVQAQLSRDLALVPDLLWLLWLLVLLRALWRLYEWSQDWFVVTNRRLMLNYGVVTRRVAMMPMKKVTDMSFNKTPMGQLLGYGEFVLESAGQDQALRVVSWLPNPDTLYQLICTELFGADPPLDDEDLDVGRVDERHGIDAGRPSSSDPEPAEPPGWRGFRLGPRDRTVANDDGSGDEPDSWSDRSEIDVVDDEQWPDEQWPDEQWPDEQWPDEPDAGSDDAADAADAAQRQGRLSRLDPRRPLRRLRPSRWLRRLDPRRDRDPG